MQRMHFLFLLFSYLLPHSIKVQFCLYGQKNDQTSDYCLFIYVVPSCGMNGGICVILWPILKNCCLSNSNFVFCGDIAQLLVFNCFLRKEQEKKKKKRPKMFVTGRLLQTYLQNNAVFLSILQCHS